MFERFTEQARRSLFFARYEASELGSIVIDTEHLLLGLLREDKGLTGILLARSRISRDDVRRELEGRSVSREKVSTSVEIPFSEQAKRSLQFASEEADELSHNYIGTEHLLLGILREEASVAAAALIHRGMHRSAVREDLQRLLNEPASGIEVDSDTNPGAWWCSAEPESPGERLRHSNWTLRLRDGRYWFLREGDAPEGPYGPYCATCWDTERRWVRMVGDARGQMRCEHCGER